MPLQIYEKMPGQQLSGGQTGVVEVQYLIRGHPITDADADVQDASQVLLANTDEIRWGLVRELVPSIEEVGPALWTATLQYVPPDQWSGGNLPGKKSERFSIGYETAHITQSKLTRTRTARAGVTLPARSGIIGWDGETAEGTDIVVPAHQFEETHILPAEQVSNAWRLQLRNAVGCTNLNPFRGHAADECLFLGAAGGTLGIGGPWEVTFIWAAGRNLSNFEVDDLIVLVKKAWDYLWVKYEKYAEGDMIYSRPVIVNVERVYDQFNFDTLGIPD